MDTIYCVLYIIKSTRYALRPRKYFRRVCKTSYQKGERAKAGNILEKVLLFLHPAQKGKKIEVPLDSPPHSATISYVSLLRTVTKKEAISSATPVRPSVHMKQLRFRRTDISEILYG